MSQTICLSIIPYKPHPSPPTPNEKRKKKYITQLRKKFPPEGTFFHPQAFKHLRLVGVQVHHLKTHGGLKDKNNKNKKTREWWCWPPVSWVCAGASRSLSRCCRLIGTGSWSLWSLAWLSWYWGLLWCCIHLRRFILKMVWVDCNHSLRWVSIQNQFAEPN